MAPRNVIYVTGATFVVLVATFLIHTYTPMKPIIYITSPLSRFIDIIAIITILCVFAFVSWSSISRSSALLKRALEAEANLQSQKNVLAIELEKQSTKLRESQLQQIEQLHHFAIIGQSTTATLHELSNHLSILNMDLDDIKQQHKHSKAIAHAEHSIRHINAMVQKARTHLASKKQPSTFNVYAIVSRAIKDVQPKFAQAHIKLTASGSKKSRSFLVYGSSINLMQCVTILLDNAYDACANIPQARVRVTLALNDVFSITVTDNGAGVPKNIKQKLFRPLESSKIGGLGVGLYITKTMIETQFKGTLELLDTPKGASFKITLPNYQANTSQPS